jgi:hypothetical protein
MPVRLLKDAAMGNQVATNGVDLEVCRALERNCAESPYLARQLSAYAELDGKHKRAIYTGPGCYVA